MSKAKIALDNYLDKLSGTHMKESCHILAERYLEDKIAHLPEEYSHEIEAVIGNMDDLAYWTCTPADIKDINKELQKSLHGIFKEKQYLLDIKAISFLEAFREYFPSCYPHLEVRQEEYFKFALQSILAFSQENNIDITGEIHAIYGDYLE